ncbi:unnamed protein product [Ranitomeya imitator]|uniref:Tc1-like transposase DDE domain-containing protein n=1 Tax=Ranitomeya imitator TaxID=111125 RepID=A0ABN9MIT6_9NEOB|nr:unnamed protein product [Ranitomeya imitator]
MPHLMLNTSESLAAMGIKGDKFMAWPPSFPDLNRTENLWSIIKQKIYEGGRQFTSKQRLWEAILTSCKEVQAETLQKLTSSMDARIVKIDYISVIKMHFGTNLPTGRFGGRTAHAPAILEDGGAQGQDGRDPGWIVFILNSTLYTSPTQHKSPAIIQAVRKIPHYSVPSPPHLNLLQRIPEPSPGLKPSWGVPQPQRPVSGRGSWVEPLPPAAEALCSNAGGERRQRGHMVEKAVALQLTYGASTGFLSLVDGSPLSVVPSWAQRNTVIALLTCRCDWLVNLTSQITAIAGGVRDSSHRNPITTRCHADNFMNFRLHFIVESNMKLQTRSFVLYKQYVPNFDCTSDVCNAYFSLQYYILHGSIRNPD